MHFKEQMRFIFISLLLCSLCFSCYMALDCGSNGPTVSVDQSGKGKYAKIQDAIDSVPDENSNWFTIKISAGKFREKVTINAKKSCIVLDGAGAKSTYIDWGDHSTTASSCTFATLAENFVARGITFQNTYNAPLLREDAGITQAVAAMVSGDKSLFVRCSFIGLQDTLWDDNGRHLFYECYIQGGVDFIFGSAQSIYEKCQIRADAGQFASKMGYGVVTAHRRESDKDPGGFVFKNCTFGGNLKAYLGRPWRPFARVIIYSSYISDIIFPEGWSSGTFPKDTGSTTFVEINNSGPGANSRKRVGWRKSMSGKDLLQLLDTSTFISRDGWLIKLPIAY